VLSVILIAAVFPQYSISAQKPAAKESASSTVEQEKAAVSHLEDAWLSAIVNANTDAIAEILADDFLRPAPDSGQFVGKPELLSYYRSHLSPQKSNRKSIEHLTVSIYGTTAIARGTLNTTSADGQVSRQLFTDVFILRNGKWQAVSAQENPVPPLTPTR
jgi:hypothetical protein